MQKWKKSLAALLMAGLFLTAGGCRAKQQEIYDTGAFREETALSGGGEAVRAESEGLPVTEAPEAPVCVYVCGAVKNPGIYELPQGARIFEAIQKAGGFSPEADQEWLNQAEQVRDGQRLRVYTAEETAGLEEDGVFLDNRETWKEGPQKINLNTASKDELMTLSGIGEAKAEAILAYRREHGAFASIEEIQNIPGIKSAVFSKIKDQIVV